MFYTILTDIGKAKIANATALGTVVQLTHIAVGDGNGVEIVPDQTDNVLANEVWRAALNSINIDPANPDWIVAEGYIPSTDGGFTVREVGLFDLAGDMIAIGSYPDTYKPTLASGSAKDLYIKVIIEVSSASSVELKIDPAVVLASRAFTDATYLKKDGDQTKTGTLTLESSPIIPDPTAAQHAASMNYVNIRTGLDPLIYSLGQPGEIGFGIATAPKAMYEQIGAIPLSGHDVLGHENYGNYMHGYSGAILCFEPKHYIKITGNLYEYADVPTTGYVLERSFINGGIEIPGVFVAKYPITKNGTIASAQRFKDPMSTSSAHNPISTLAGTPVNNYGGLYTAVKTMSAEAFLTPAYHYSMLARMAKAHGEAALSTTACAFIDVLPKLPKGCNNNALSDAQDASVLYASSGYSNCGLTGSASNFAKTTHNGQACGIADLNGNMWEVASGFIRYTANGFLVLKESVDIRTIINDSITAGAGGAYDVNLYDVIDISDVVFDATTTYFGNGTNQVFAMSTDRASAAYKRTALGIPTATGVSATGTTEFGNDGLYRNLVDQMACFRGGYWTDFSGAGVSAMHLHNPRTDSNHSVCGRASFLCV